MSCVEQISHGSRPSSESIAIRHEVGSQRYGRRSGPYAPPAPAPLPEGSAHIDPSETQIIASEREVLKNLWRVGVGMEPEMAAGISLATKVRSDPRIQTVTFLGSPGVGKSTAIEQFIEELFSLAGEEIAIKITSFDSAFQRMLKYAPREFWDGKHWEVINDSLILTAKQKHKKRPNGRRIHPAREIHIVEVPFVGNRATSDRGRSFVEKIWEEYRDANESEAMIFVPFAPIEATVKKTQSLREELLEAKTRHEQLLVLAKHGIEISEDMLHRAGKYAKETLETLIQQILKSANKKQQALVTKDLQTAMKGELPELSFDLLQQLVMLPDEAKIPSSTRVSLQRHIFYWDKIFDEMGVPSQGRYIMINPPLSQVHRTPVRSIKKAA